MAEARPDARAKLASVLAQRLGQSWAFVRTPVLVGLTSRLGLVLVAYLGLSVVAMNPDPAVGGPEHLARAFPGNLLIDGWTRWDAGWYNQVAISGYHYRPEPGALNNVVFFPLYPFLMSIVGRVVGNTLIAGMLISNVAFLLGLTLLYHHTRRRFDESTAFRTIVLLSVYPFAFYFTAVYSEALFFMLVVAAFFLADRECWWAAGLCGFFAGLTRVAGIVMLPVLLLLYLEKTNFSLRRSVNLLWIGLAGAGPLVYFGYLSYRFGNPWLYLAAQRAPGWWLGELAGDLLRETITQAWNLRNIASGAYPTTFVFNLLLALLFVGTLVSIRRRQGLGAGAFVALMILVSATQWINAGRYLMPAFPAFVAGAIWVKSERRFLALVIVSALFLSLWTLAYTHSYWVT